MLIAHDMDTHLQYSPWLAGVLVSPPHRCRGIGRALSEHVTREAERLGYGTLYLYTPSAHDFYSGFGWSTLEHAHYRGVDVTIMRTPKPPNQAMQLTASKPDVGAWSDCPRERLLRFMHSGLAAADDSFIPFYSHFVLRSMSLAPRGSVLVFR
jgi:hypothetical protein